ncbi:MAG: hypothetical protein JXQ90_23905 [Cyclobacteriaceae bacterium]
MKQLLIVAFSFSAVVLFGQRKEKDTSEYIQQSGRIEFEISQFHDDFHLVNGRENGLLVVNETQNRVEGGYGWVMHKLNTDLQTDWTKLIIRSSSHSLMGWDYSEGYYYLLFSIDEYRHEKLEVVKIDAEDGQIRSVEISTVFPLSLSYFEVVNNVALLAGITNYRPAILTFDLDDRTPRVIPGIYDEKMEIANISVDRELEGFTVSMVEQLFNKQLSVRVNTYTMDNILIQNNLINPGDRKNLIHGASTSFDNGFQYIAGTYSKKSHLYSQGIYLSKFVNGRQQFIKYYDYGELTNFFEYLGDKREARLKGRIAEKKQKGKTSRLSYRLMIHDIIPRGDEYILIGEAYYPRYSSYSSYAPGMSYGGASNVIGYKYTHAIIVAFDANGNITWDHSFPIDDVFRFFPDEIVSVNALQDRIELLYLEKNLIRSKAVVGHEVLEGKSYTPIQLSSPDEQMMVRDPEIEELKKWYGPYLFAFGEQQIVQKDSPWRARRKVFYINKIHYDFDDVPN